MRLPPEGRVFGIGLSKTGTSSLNEALTLLGLPSIHYPSDARTEEQLRSRDFRLDILGRGGYRGATDIPIAPFYRELDAAWPGSRFVLTVRDKASWLRSVEVHWKLMMEWWTGLADFRRFQSYVSQAAYGAVEFDRERFSASYDDHVAGISAYFGDRPGDLLVLDVCGGAGWGPLCAFLDVPAPGAPFPRANEWMHLLLEASREVAEIVPAGATFILADEAGFGREFAPGRRLVPLLERDGEYAGRPADDDAAIAGVERLRAGGAEWLIVGWPAFWWLDHYQRFADHLRARYRCVSTTERLVAFDLR
jgi:hypothetical protein